MLQFTFEKNNLLCKKREKNNLSRGKIPAPPLDIKWSVPNQLPDIGSEIHDRVMLNIKTKGLLAHA